MDINKFKNPPAKFKGAPFWGWNGKMDKAELESQIETFKKMGFGGYHIHPRSGMDTEYMGEEYMSLVKACVEKGKSEGMYTYLYDEDRWPSGFAGGLVTENPEYRARHLLLTTVSYEEYGEVNPTPNFSVTQQRSGNGELFACYDIVLNDDGTLKSYKQISPEATVEGTKWYAYAETAICSPWFNGYTNVDVLNPDATDKFLEVTHQRYFDEVGEDFGGYIPSIFGDEAQVAHKHLLNSPFDTTDVILAWTPRLPEEYAGFYGEDLAKDLPLIVWNGENAGAAKYRYHNLIAELFARNYIDRIGDWCRKHNIKFTGHMISEGVLPGQVLNVGDVMRAYRGLDIPGVDILNDSTDYISIKQAVSASRQMGAGGVLCELYGVTDWDFDFRDHKHQGDWQAALGVTLRCHHLSWYTMEGEAKRDYPPSLNYHAPWCEQYKYLEDHYSRINYITSLGKPNIKIGVMNPIETEFVLCGTEEESSRIQNELQQSYNFTACTLMKNCVDFDCISEANMESQYKPSNDGKLHIGSSAYEVVILPRCTNMRKSTQDMLVEFEKNGGKLIFISDVPVYTDGVFGKTAFSDRTPLNETARAILEAVEDYREIRIRNAWGMESDGFFHNYITTEDKTRYLFLAQNSRPSRKNNYNKQTVTISIDGEFAPTVLDTLSCDMYAIDAEYKNGKTYIKYDFYDNTSLMLKLEQKRASETASLKKSVDMASVALDNYMDYTLSEPNVLLLDRAEFSLNGGDFTEEKDILAGDNDIRTELGLPLRMDVLLQPWVVEDKYPHTVTLKLEFLSEIAVENTYFCAEHIEDCTVNFNGADIPTEICGYYADRSIKKIKLGTVNKGVNTILLTMPFGEKSNIENCFVAGEFGVRVDGAKAVITNLPEKLSFGDVTKQGLAFYGGNITYHIEASGDLEVSRINYIGGTVDVNGSMDAVFAPYGADVSCDKLDITVYGNRFNTFGAVHNMSGRRFVSHPNEWRVSGTEWTDTYLIRPWGLMAEPIEKKII